MITYDAWSYWNITCCLRRAPSPKPILNLPHDSEDTPAGKRQRRIRNENAAAVRRLLGKAYSDLLLGIGLPESHHHLLCGRCAPVQSLQQRASLLEWSQTCACAPQVARFEHTRRSLRVRGALQVNLLYHLGRLQAARLRARRARDRPVRHRTNLNSIGASSDTQLQATMLIVHIDLIP